jgi:hypothetical protein
MDVSEARQLAGPRKHGASHVKIRPKDGDYSALKET